MAGRGASRPQRFTAEPLERRALLSGQFTVVDSEPSNLVLFQAPYVTADGLVAWGKLPRPGGSFQGGVLTSLRGAPRHVLVPMSGGSVELSGFVPDFAMNDGGDVAVRGRRPTELPADGIYRVSEGGAPELLAGGDGFAEGYVDELFSLEGDEPVYRAYLNEAVGGYHSWIYRGHTPLQAGLEPSVQSTSGGETVSGAALGLDVGASIGGMIVEQVISARRKGAFGAAHVRVREPFGGAVVDEIVAVDLAPRPDLIAGGTQWDATTGQATVSYTTAYAATSGGELSVFWAKGPDVSDAIGEPLYGGPVDGSPGAHSVTFDMPGGLAPVMATHLLLVVDAAGTVAEANEANNVSGTPFRRVINVLTHGFGAPYMNADGERVVLFEDFESTWSRFEAQVAAIGAANPALQVVTVAPKWDSSSDWVAAAASFAASAAYGVLGRPADAARALLAAREQMRGAERRAKEAADEIVDSLLGNYVGWSPARSQVGMDVIHLIGHSRGAAVNARVAEILAGMGYRIDQFTSLDGFGTDWPKGGGILGDTDIVARTGNRDVVHKFNYVPQVGLERVFLGPVQQFLRDVTPYWLGASFTELMVAGIQLVLSGLRAPERSGFVNEVITGSGAGTAHFQAAGYAGIADTYFASSGRGAGERYVLDSFMGLHSGWLTEEERANLHYLAAGSGTGSGGAAGEAVRPAGSGAPADPEAAVPDRADFVDGSFEEVAALYRELNGISPAGDDGVDAWAGYVRSYGAFLHRQWSATGNVSLETGPDGNARLYLGQPFSENEPSASIGQTVDVRGFATLEFDLERVSMFGNYTPGRVDVYVGGSFVQSVQADAFGGRRRASVYLDYLNGPTRVTLKLYPGEPAPPDAGEETFPPPPWAPSPPVWLDNLKVLSSTPQAGPVVTGIADVTVPSGTTAVSVDLRGGFEDDDTPDEQLEYWIKSNSAPQLFGSVSADAATGRLELELKPGAAGYAVFTVVGYDRGHSAAVVTFRVGVGPRVTGGASDEEFVVRREGAALRVATYASVGRPASEFVVPWNRLPALSIDGGGGVDLLTLDFTDGDVVPDAGGIHFAGAGGTGRVVVIGLNAGDGLRVGPAAATMRGGTISYPSGTRIQLGSSGGDPVEVASVEIADGGMLVLPAGRNAVVVGTLLIAPRGLLDVGRNVVTISGGVGESAAAALNAAVAAGSNGGRWDGRTGVISSAATDGGSATGVGFAVGAARATLRWTFYGDANLDGAVSADDVATMLLGQATGRRDWQAGDFNFDNQISSDDWSLFAWGAAKSVPVQSGVFAAGGGPAAVAFAGGEEISRVADEVLTMPLG